MTNRSDQRPLLLPSRPALSESLTQVLGLVTRDFVHSWYHDLTDDSDFAREIHAAVGHVCQQLETRARRIDWPDLLIHGVVPVVRAHIQDYRQVAAKVGTGYGGGQHSPDDLFHRIQPHPALDMPLNETRYFRRLTDQILPLVLQPADCQSPSVRYFIREVVTNVVWKNLVDALSEPSMVHEAMITIAMARLDLGATADGRHDWLLQGFDAHLRWSGALQSTHAINIWKKQYPHAWARIQHQYQSDHPVPSLSVAERAHTSSPANALQPTNPPPATATAATVEDLLKEAQSTNLQASPSSDQTSADQTPLSEKDAMHSPTSTPVIYHIRPLATASRSRLAFVSTVVWWLGQIIGSIGHYAYLLAAQAVFTFMAFFSSYTISVKSGSPAAHTKHSKSLLPPRRRAYVTALAELTNECLCLSHVQGWLVAHAMHYILPLADALFGETIDRQIRDFVQGQLCDERLAQHVDTLRQALWPQGRFLRDRPMLSNAERYHLCHDAELLLQEILP
ncbi:hypothetical protein H4R35_007049, partial [Dimargaris xerosporica]